MGNVPVYVQSTSVVVEALQSQFVPVGAALMVNCAGIGSVTRMPEPLSTGPTSAPDKFVTASVQVAVLSTGKMVLLTDLLMARSGLR